MAFAPSPSVQSPAGAVSASAGAHAIRGARAYAALAAILVGAAVVRAHDLGSESLWYDEIFGLALVRQPLPVVLEVINGFVANMALYLILMHFWMALFDPAVSDAVPRIPSVIFGVGGVAALYGLGSDLFGKRVGLAAALLLAANPYHVGWSQDARAYTLWVLLVTLSFWVLVRAVRAPGRHRWWVAYALVTALAFYSHLFTAFIVAAQTLWLLPRRRRSELVPFAFSLLATAALLLPLAQFGISNTDGSQLRHVPLPDWKDVRFLLTSYAGSDWLQYAYAAMLGAGVVFLAFGKRGAESERWWLGLLVLWLLLMPVLIFGLSFAYKPLYKDRYLFASLPALCLLAGVGLGRLRPSILAAVVVVGVAWLSSSAVAQGFAVRRTEEWRPAIGHLAAQSRPGDGWIFISRRNHLPWQYYAPRYGRDPYAIDDIEPFDWSELARSRVYRAPAFSRADLDRFSTTHPRIWLVLSHEFDAFEADNERGDTSTWVRDRLTRSGYGARQRIFPGVRVLLYERR